MSTRELRVRFTGDAGDLRSTFQEVNASATQAGAGLKSAGTGADDAGKTLTRTGKVFRGAGRAMKGAGLDATAAGAAFASSIPALSGVAGGLGLVATGGDAVVGLLGSMSATGGPAALILTAVASAATVAAAAFFGMRNSVNLADVVLDDYDVAVDEVARSTSRAAAAQRDFALSLDALKAAGREEERAKLSLADAEQAYADAVRTSGRGSRQAKEALLDVADAEARVSQSRREGIRTAQQAITLGERSSRRADNEVKQAREAAAAVRSKAALIRTGLVPAAAAEKITNALAQADRRVVSASKSAEARHRANAGEARRLAGAVQGAGSNSNALRTRLIELANTEFSLASQIAQIQLAGAVAAGAAGAVGGLADALYRAARAPAPRAVGGGRGGGGGGGGKRSKELGGGAGYGQKDYVRRAAGVATAAGAGAARSLVERGAGLRGVAPGSPTDIERTTARGQRTADVAQANAEDTARKAGKTEDQVRIDGERAYNKARLANIKRLRGKIKTRYGRRVRLLKDARKTLRATKVPSASSTDSQKKARDKAIDKRNKLRDKINGILDELETLAANDADLVVEGRKLGEDQQALKREEAANEADAAAEAASDAQDVAEAAATSAAETAANAPTIGDVADAAAAEAALTPGIEDDIAAAVFQEQVAAGNLNAARASGDPRAIAEAARAYLQARQNREQIEATTANTDAVTANTDAITQAFGGSNIIGYRGQDFIIRSLAPPSSDRLTGVEVGI